MNNNLDYDVGGSFSMGKAGLAEGTNAATLKTTNALNFCLKGIAYAKAATDNIAMTALDQQADLTSCLYTVGINASGTVKVFKGVEQLTTEVDKGDVPLYWPRVDSGYVAIGGFRIVLDGGTFTSGTTDLSGTGVTDTYYDFAFMPSEPIVSST